MHEVSIGLFDGPSNGLNCHASRASSWCSFALCPYVVLLCVHLRTLYDEYIATTAMHSSHGRQCLVCKDYSDDTIRVCVTKKKKEHGRSTALTCMVCFFAAGSTNLEVTSLSW